MFSTIANKVLGSFILAASRPSSDSKGSTGCALRSTHFMRPIQRPLTPAIHQMTAFKYLEIIPRVSPAAVKKWGCYYGSVREDSAWYEGRGPVA